MTTIEGGAAAQRRFRLRVAVNEMSILDHWKERRPEWFTETLLDDFGPGWSAILDECLRDIETALGGAGNFRISRIKPKIGALVVYVRGSKLADELEEIVRRRLQRLWERSLIVCELCGKPGRRGADEGRISVRCEPCAAPGWVAD